MSENHVRFKPLLFQLGCRPPGSLAEQHGIFRALQARMRIFTRGTGRLVSENLHGQRWCFVLPVGDKFHLMPRISCQHLD